MTRRSCLVPLGALWFCALFIATLASGPVSDVRQRSIARAQAPFAARIAALSEPAGYFDTDNLISNERSYLQILPDLERQTSQGGVYIGVGPDQNFSYIAVVRPSIAFLVDIRRENLLLHLLFKALFAEARTRVEYLTLLLGRRVPHDLDSWRDAGLDRLLSAADAAPDRAVIDALRSRLDQRIVRFGVPLSREDLATIDRFHRRFIESGLALRFESYGRPPQSGYPTYRDLLLETDAHGRQRNYLASEDAFQFLKSLHARDLIVPVVGDLSGPSALIAVGRLIRERGERLSAFYASNVEDYLFRYGRYQRFVQNLGGIPHDDRSVVIRSIFNRWLSGSRPGDLSTSRLQRVDELLSEVARGRIQSYQDLVSR
jgi:hypothetical protein